MTNEIKLKDPAPIGLIGFGLAMIILISHNAGFDEVNSMMLVISILYGGIALVLSGMMDFYNEKTHGGRTIIATYWFIWLSLIALFVIPQLSSINDLKLTWAGKLIGMIGYLLVWCILIIWIFFFFLKIRKVFRSVFIGLALLFSLLAIGRSIPTIDQIAGYVGIICGVLAIYLALALVVNEMCKKDIFPVGIG